MAKIKSDQEVLEEVAPWFFGYSEEEKNIALGTIMSFIPISDDAYLGNGTKAGFLAQKMLHQVQSELSQNMIYYPQYEALVMLHRQGICLEWHLKNKDQSIVATVAISQQGSLGISIQKPDGSRFDQLIRTKSGIYEYLSSSIPTQTSLEKKKKL